MKLIATILPIDRPTANGRIYSREVVNKMIEDFQPKINEGTALAAALTRSDDYSLDLQNVGAKVEELCIIGDNVVALMDTLPTPLGRTWESMVEEMHFTISGTGTLEDNKVTKFSLRYVAAVPK